jgi:hypothetical protein
MSDFDRHLASRLAKIALRSYRIDRPAEGLTDLQLGFLSPPQEFISGQDRIDACLLGRAADGIVLAFRGTLPLVFDQGQDKFISSVHDWLQDGRADLVPAPNGMDGNVHRGFFDALNNLQAQFMPQLEQLQKAKPERLLITGHSKGGAVAVIAAAALLGRFPVAALYTFAAPRPGSIEFVRDVAEKIPNFWRLEFQDDIVPHLPPVARLLDYFANNDPSLRALATALYRSAGALQFLNWDTPIGMVVDSQSIDMERALRLANRLLRLELEEIANCHSLDNCYIPAIDGTAPPRPLDIARPLSTTVSHIDPLNQPGGA